MEVSRVSDAVKAIDERLTIHDFRYVEGVTHSNLIFDVTVPFEIKESNGAIEERICAMADTPGLNVNSGRQIGELLFAKMRIAEKPKMTKTKQFCTDEEYLTSLSDKHPIVSLVLEYRGLKKLLFSLTKKALSYNISVMPK